jgi:hypothetical protein
VGGWVITGWACNGWWGGGSHELMREMEKNGMAWHGIDAFETLEASLCYLKWEWEIDYTMEGFFASIAPSFLQISCSVDSE